MGTKATRPQRPYSREHDRQWDGSRERRRVERNAESQAGASRNGKPWTPEELQAAARDDLTVAQTAAKLGRTYESVRAIRYQLRLRAVDDPVALARAARIVRIALARKKLSVDELTDDEPSAAEEGRGPPGPEMGERPPPQRPPAPLVSRPVSVDGGCAIRWQP